MEILVLPGDGIGPEITAATVKILKAASHRFNLGLALVEDVVGHESLQALRHHGAARGAGEGQGGAGPRARPHGHLRLQGRGKGEINPSRFFRKSFDLFANIRPARTYPGAPGRVGDFDLVVVRENTEGFYADRNMELGNGELLVTPDVAISMRRITRQCCERIARAGFELAMRRRRHVTLVHKANVLKIGDGLFLDECRKVAAEFPDVRVDDIIVDAMMAHVVRDPGRFDVIVTTNMFGDILSDLTAELSGSLGLGGALNAGAGYAMAQAAHGSAPDIAGQNIANPLFPGALRLAAVGLAWPARGQAGIRTGGAGHRHRGRGGHRRP